MSLPLNQVILGDCIEVMAGWSENSVDCIVSDPPYGISFMGKKWDQALPPKEAFEQMIRVLKPGALAFVMSSPRQDVLWRMLAMLEGVGFELRQSHISWIFKTGFPKAYNFSKGIHRKLRLEREKLGVAPTSRPDTNVDGQVLNWGGHGHGKTRYVTEPASDLAKKWQGYKSQTGLKPAVEMVLMVNKPRSEPTIVDNVLRWGTGAVNVDACRIPVDPKIDDMLRTTQRKERETATWREGSGFSNPNNPLTGVRPEGRFPANLLVSDKALDTGKLSKSGKIEPHHKLSSDEEGKIPSQVYGKYTRQPASKVANKTYGDIGDQSRYFDLDAWAEHHGFLDVAKPSRAERDLGLEHMNLRKKGRWNKAGVWQEVTRKGNYHPTVKPTRLMAYLISLGCPPDGVVVDPFLGSGTTCIAAKRLRRKWIGIEIDPEYVDIARARIKAQTIPPIPIDRFMESKDEK